MSDLISRSELLKSMDTWDKFGYDEHNRLIRIDSTNEEYVPYVRYEDMVNCVMNMPTAYDVDKVVDELEETGRCWKGCGMMERLTKTYSDGTHGAADNLPCGENSYTYKGLLLEALGKYEDAEEQGLLLRLPAEAYFIKDNIVRKGWVQELAYSPCRKLLLDIRYDDSSLDSYRGYLGNDVFLTQAEAEQKLKEMENDNNGTMES